jgi:hypothetical protein
MCTVHVIESRKRKSQSQFILNFKEKMSTWSKGYLILDMLFNKLHRKKKMEMIRKRDPYTFLTLAFDFNSTISNREHND